jgi:hypothetical protein
MKQSEEGGTVVKQKWREKVQVLVVKQRGGGSVVKKGNRRYSGEAKGGKRYSDEAN